MQDYKILNLEDLRQNISGIDQDFGAYLATNAVVCFLMQGHQTGVVLKVQNEKGEIIENFVVHWEKQLTPKDLQSYKDKKEVANYAGMALAVLVMLQLTDYKDFERTESNGVGVDFWLKKSANTLDFENSARLEVSAILSATPKNMLRTRLQQKITQSQQSDDTNTDAYIIVVDFKEPEMFYHLRLIQTV
ncbi:MAG: hypothetical protein EAZ95_06115 [Bacteroidetes bacterium]|nr:MAG: hypothetical protein EAZ95_06115 [Bacteroidota bacterium]